MRGEVTGTEYFMAVSPAGSECPQPRARPGHVCSEELALIVWETRQEQSPKPGGEPLTGIDESPIIWTQPAAAFSSQQNICFLPLPSGSWELPQRREFAQAITQTSQDMWMEQKYAEGGKWPGPPREPFTLSDTMWGDLSGGPARPFTLKCSWELPPPEPFTDQFSHDSAPHAGLLA